jgi:phosphoglycerol transferase MdoB-like AlkP superfamily enzyme
LQSLRSPTSSYLLLTRSLRTVWLMIVLPAMPVAVLSSWFFINLPIVNLDATLCVLVMLSQPRLGLLMLGISWFLALIVGMSATYHFARPTDFIAAARYLLDVRVSDLLTPGLAIALVPFAVCTLLIWRGASLARANSLALVAVLSVALIALDAVNGSSALWHRATRISALNLAGSPAYTLAAQLVRQHEDSPMSALPESETAAALIDVRGWAFAHPERSVVFVIVESFGLANESAPRDWLADQLSRPAKESGYGIVQGAVPFRGATTSGELRQLCALTGSYRALNSEWARQCLPNQLRVHGWHTIGLHGFSKRMFDRENWWPLIGIEAAHFVDDGTSLLQARCGAAFRGLCDEVMIDRAFAEAVSPKNFVYLLTLNTHLPLEQRPIPADLKSLCHESQLGDDGCLMVASLGVVLGRIGEAARAAKVPPLVIVVGDHAPPFAQRATRARFDASRVPVIVLLPAETQPTR